MRLGTDVNAGLKEMGRRTDVSAKVEETGLRQARTRKRERKRRSKRGGLRWRGQGWLGVIPRLRSEQPRQRGSQRDGEYIQSTSGQEAAPRGEKE